MLFCPNCGTKNEDNAKFCGNCGTKLEGVPVVSDIPAESPAEEQNIEAAPESTPWEQNVEVTPESTPWEQDNTESLEPVWEAQEEPKQKQQEGPLRPSQMKRARQQEQTKNGSSITIKKPNIDVKQYREKAKGLSKMQIAVILEIIALIAVIGIFCGIGSSKSSAEATAKRYFQAYIDRDWEEYYDLTDYPSGKFLQKAQFVEMMEDAYIPDITGFEVTAESQETSGIQKSYNIQYTVKGEGSNYMSIVLTKQSEKSMLFFDTWKVSPNFGVAQNFNIYIPTGASATVDGGALTDSDKTESDSEGMDCYQISLFAGDHTLQVAAPWFELYETEFYAYSGDYFTVSGMALTEEGKTAIQAKMQEGLEKIYLAAATEADFSEVEDLFLEEYKESGRDSYEYLVEKLNGSESYKLNQVAFSEFDCDVYTDSYSGLLNADMTFDYELQYTYTYTSWRNSTKKSEEKSYDGNTYMSASFGYNGETYKFTSVNIQSVL